MKQYGIYNTKYNYWEFNKDYDVYVFDNINVARAQASALESKDHWRDELKFEVREFPENDEENEDGSD